MSVPKFELGAILSIAPIACVTFMEHIGDVTTNGTVVGKDFLKDPGLHRTLMGDGLATLFAGLIGGPANTTYSENTGVLATTKNYNPRLLRVTAIFAIILGLFGKVGAILQTIPGPVKGGVEVMLFGMIAAVGIRSLAESDLDFTHSRNLTIVDVYKRQQILRPQESLGDEAVNPFFSGTERHGTHRLLLDDELQTDLRLGHAGGKNRFRLTEIRNLPEMRFRRGTLHRRIRKTREQRFKFQPLHVLIGRRGIERVDFGVFIRKRDFAVGTDCGQFLAQPGQIVVLL